MFHRPTSTLSQNHLNHRPPLRGMSVQNENSVNLNSNIKNAASSSSMSTPKQQHRPQRRAFGDISNSKANGSSNNSAKPGNGKSGIPTLKKKQGGLTPRPQIPRLTTSKTMIPSSKLKLPSSQSASRSSSQTSKSKTPASFLPSRRSNSSTTVTRKPLATRTNLAPSVSSKTASVRKTSVRSLEPVDDVELPAGRTFLQQQRRGDHDDDDDSSTSSFGSTFKATTMWDDWGSSLKQQYLQKDEFDRDEEQDMAVQAHIDRVLKEQDEGLECLLDFVDNLDLDDGPIFDDDADDWSQPASSVLGGIRTEELDESLLFEI